MNFFKKSTCKEILCYQGFEALQTSTLRKKGVKSEFVKIRPINRFGYHL